MANLQRIKKFQNLPENIQNLLLSEEYHLFLDNIAQQTSLNQLQRYWLSYAVSTIFLKEVALNKMVEYLQKELQINQAKAFKISQLLYENIINKYKDYFAPLPLKALAKALAPENKPTPEKPIPRLKGNIVDLRQD